MIKRTGLVFGVLLAFSLPLKAAQIDTERMRDVGGNAGVFQVAQDIQPRPRKVRPSNRPPRLHGTRPSNPRPTGVTTQRPHRPNVVRPSGGAARPVIRPGHRPSYVGSPRPGYRPGNVGLRPVYRPGYRPGWRPPPGYAGWRPGWRPRPYYGRYWSPGIGWVAAAAAGIVAIGVLTNIEAEEYNVPPAPSDDMCWFYTDEQRNKGYWAKCPPLADAPPNTPLIPLP